MVLCNLSLIFAFVLFFVRIDVTCVELILTYFLKFIIYSIVYLFIYFLVCEPSP